MTTNTFVRPPVLPPFICETEEGGVLQNGLFMCETPVFEVRKRMAYTSCEPLLLTLTICDRCDETVDSAAFIDDVQITFENLPGTFFVSPGRGGGAHALPPIEHRLWGQAILDQGPVKVFFTQRRKRPLHAASFFLFP